MAFASNDRIPRSANRPTTKAKKTTPHKWLPLLLFLLPLAFLAGYCTKSCPPALPVTQSIAPPPAQSTAPATLPAVVAQPEEKQPSTNTETVLVCEGSSAYAFHSHQCRGLSRCTHRITEMSRAQAKNRGRRACKLCY